MECPAWTKKAYQRIAALQPDAVIYSTIVTPRYSRAEWKAGIRGLPDALNLHKGHILVLGDEPRPPNDIPHCLSMQAWRQMIFGWAHLPLQGCYFNGTNDFRAEVLHAWETLSQRSSQLRYIDVNSLVCANVNFCDPVEKRTGIVKYRDEHHLTASFVKSIKGALDQRLETSLGWSQSDVSP